MSIIIAMATFSFAMSISPGPVTMMTVISGANHGFWRTLPFVSGATIGFTLLLVISGLGITQFVQQYPMVMDILLLGGCGFIAYMGVGLAGASLDVSEKKRNIPHFREGFLLQWLNPKAWVACVAGVSVFSADDGHASLMLFSGIYFCVCYLCIGFWAYAGDKARAFLYEERGKRTFNFIMGCLLVLVSVFLLLDYFLLSK